MKKISKKILKNGFTLSEVLITISIIGVVAAITMPVFISNIQNFVKAKRIENIQQKFSKATDKMLAVSGMNNYSSTEDFVYTFKKHLSLAKICSNTNLRSCWPTDIVITGDKEWEIANTTTGRSLKMVNDENHEWDKTVGIITADGTSMIMSYNKKCNMDQTTTPNWGGSKSSSTNCIAAVYDWNGKKAPNTFGMLTTDKNDVIPLNANGLGDECSIVVNGKCFGSFFKPEAINYNECLTFKDQWKIRGCMYANDYWGGAVKQCGGIDNMPSHNDLVALQNELKQGEWETNMQTLGLPPYATIWTNEEEIDVKAYATRIVENETNKYWLGKNDSSNWAVCLTE